MKLYAEILAHYLSQKNAQIIFPDLQMNAKEIMEQQCYLTLCKIKSIIQDDTLEDKESFERIEEIICAFEDVRSNCGNRHDFG